MSGKLEHIPISMKIGEIRKNIKINVSRWACATMVKFHGDL